MMEAPGIFSKNNQTFSPKPGAPIHPNTSIKSFNKQIPKM
jgi:hypothetical protein